MKQLRSSTPDLQTSTKAWLEQLQEHANQKGIMRYVWAKEQKIYRRFVYFYGRLSQLSRRYRRAIQRVLGVGLTTAAFLLAVGFALPVKASTITVDGTTCTLADAITAANTDTATNGCLAGAGDDIIDLQTDVTLSGELPYITSTLTLNGNSHTLDGAGGFRVIQIGNLDPDGRAYQAMTPTVTINDINIINGYPVDASFFPEGGGINVERGNLTLVNSLLSGHQSDTQGGAISIHYGHAEIIDSTIENSTALNGAGIYAGYSEITISNSVISGNVATGSGGGIRSEYSATTIVNSQISGNHADSYGGGAGFYYGSAVISNTHVTNNSAKAGAGVAMERHDDDSQHVIINAVISGNEAINVAGGISILYTGATIQNSEILSNSAGFVGGGIEIYGAHYDKLPSYTTTISQSTISNNHANYAGGGVSLYYSVAQIHESTISNNQTKSPDATPEIPIFTVAGGAQAYNSTLTVTKSTISGNSSDGVGGGLYFYGSNIHHVSIEQSTLSGNEAGQLGGGLFAESPNGAAVQINQSTITLNKTGTDDAESGAGIYAAEVELEIKNTIVSGNTAGSQPSEIYSYTDLHAPPQTEHNLLGIEGAPAVYGFTPDVTDITPTGNISTVLETTLANNGGETQTHMLTTNSPAIDQGIEDENTQSHDQRGWRRVIGNGLDIGSVEAPIKQFLAFIARN